ncbi:MAG TPA: tRNA uridine-5-carboxymethylaminomethyl(34) synthesis GTPase MnmE [Nitrospirota bacterium]|nr:tRNA uridine-5-carboxymethylaminomethyl(34) synthesis GTPase MnmE [Nitrospirota bacterium]
MQEQDTICAVSTPPGEGGIGIIRMSGKDAISIGAKVFKPRHDNNDFTRAATHTLHYGHVIDPGTGETVDEVLISVMRGPATYTREDVVEINCHGGMMPLWRTLGLLINAGARQADPGEFTKRAFLHGRIDLAQAEAVMDIIRAKTDLSHRAANELLMGGLSTDVSNLRDRLISLLASVEAGIDFPEEDIETDSGTSLADEVTGICTMIEGLLSSFAFGRILRDGFATAIVGRPNVGKSSLLNALLKQNRAIVTEVPGTTRDVLEEYLNVSGIPIRILDTAGIRHTHDTVEQEGVRRSLAAIESADIVLVVLDGSETLKYEDRRVLKEVEGKSAIAVINKSDLPRKLEVLDRPRIQVSLSCRTGNGLDSLKSAVSDMVKQGTVRAREHAWAVNQRHKDSLEQTKISLEKSLESINAGLSPEFIAVDLRDALDSLGLIIGATYTEDILERIFNDFCIGK